MDIQHPIRVLCVFSSLNRGGAESMCMNLYRNIDRNKVQFDFVKHSHNKGAFEDEIISLGGKIYEAPRYKIYNYLQYRSWWINHLKKHPEHQIIHGHFFTISAIYFRFAKEMHRITIGHCHSAKPDKKTIKSKLKANSMKKVELLSTYCFSCSKESGQWLFPNRKFKVLKNAIDTSIYKYNESIRTEVRKELELGDEFVVGVVGSLQPVKNPYRTIKIFKKIYEINNNSKLLWIGDGKLKNEIKQKISDEKLKNMVIMTGARSDVDRLMQAMDVLIFPSINEGLGMVAIEAQALGLHAICSDSIPYESKITDLVDFVSLEKSDIEWSQTVLQYNNGYKRTDTSDAIIKAGYDIHITSKWLEHFYLKIFERRK